MGKYAAGDGKDSGHIKFSRRLAQYDPMAAGIYVAKLPRGETQNEAVKSVISSWADQDPAQTAAWVLQFPAGDLQNQEFASGQRVNSIDPEEVQDWAVNLPDGRCGIPC